MAYANSVVFYGWLGKDALHTVNHILGKNTCKNIDDMLNNKDDLMGKMNKKINNEKLKIAIDKFEGGLCSDEKQIYLYLGKTITCCSGSDDDIDSSSYTLDELKQFLDMSFAMKNITDHKCKPKLINLVVSDSK